MLLILIPDHQTVHVENIKFKKVLITVCILQKEVYKKTGKSKNKSGVVFPT